eukprot:5693649-Pleurochrysis_carterae.AAC.3
MLLSLFGSVRPELSGQLPIPARISTASTRTTSVMLRLRRCARGMGFAGSSMAGSIFRCNMPALARGAELVLHDDGDGDGDGDGSGGRGVGDGGDDDDAMATAMAMVTFVVLVLFVLELVLVHAHATMCSFSSSLEP